MICEASKKKLTIMFDLHGVANKMPELIKPMMKTMRACGHTVIICSGPTMSLIDKELEALSYSIHHHYDYIVSVVDFLSEEGVIFSYDAKGDPWTDDATWFASKGLIADRHNVNIVIDDSPQYKDYMSENVAFWLWK